MRSERKEGETVVQGFGFMNVIWFVILHKFVEV